MCSKELELFKTSTFDIRQLKTQKKFMTGIETKKISK